MTDSGNGAARARKANQSFHLVGETRPDVGVLILHGFTGSPAEMRPLGLALHRAGFTVHCPLQPRHGDLPARLRGARHREWIDAALDGLETLASCEHLFLAGLSMGGLVSLYLAALAAGADEGFPAARLKPLSRLRGILVLAAPARVNHPRTRIVRFAKHIIPYFTPKIDFDSPKTRAWLQEQAPPGARIDFADPAERKRLSEAARIPLDAIDQLIRLNDRVIRLLSQVIAPALFVQGRLDKTVTADSAERLRRGVGSRDASAVWFERSGHVLTTDVEKDEVAALAVAFVRRLI
ncbi:MAG: alpha/beta fold hydrolase [Thermoflexales bacterium]